jgi:hypothetical protein
MDGKLGSFLADWTVNFIKNKDIIAKKIESIENGRNGFDLHVRYRDREQYFIIAPSIADIGSIISRMDNKAYYSIVTLNSRENFDSMIKSWPKLVSFKFLNIIFVNPFSQLDKKWIIFPHTHHKVCDEASLENGLKSMFEMVEPIEEAQLVAKITG